MTGWSSAGSSWTYPTDLGTTSPSTATIRCRSPSHLVSIADELQEAAEQEATRARFPRGYEPRPGDVLERRDGVLFEVIAFTGDGQGIELHGIDQPLVIYVLIDDVVGQFIGLAEDPWER